MIEPVIFWEIGDYFWEIKIEDPALDAGQEINGRTVLDAVHGKTLWSKSRSHSGGF